jgi:hypothetical protein
MGADPRVVALEAEVDGIGAILNGGDQAGSIAGGREKLGLGPHAMNACPVRSVQLAGSIDIARRFQSLDHVAAFNGRVLHKLEWRQPLIVARTMKIGIPF